MDVKKVIPKSEIRAMFSRAMSEMYAKEVPLYAKLVETVATTNTEILRENPEMRQNLGSVARITEERHGAIRIGREDEYRNMARLFAVMGMYPVGFYDLTTAPTPQPVISTAFRPVDLEELDKNPFRMFTSLLRPDDERFFDKETSAEIKTHLARREIFSDKLLVLIHRSEADGGLTETEAKNFITEAKKTFGFTKGPAPKELYGKLKNGVARDIVSFDTPHLNHLTPRTLDIDRLQTAMEGLVAKPEYQPNRGMKKKIEGPPRRDVPILLRQTSYNALDEAVTFVDEYGKESDGIHTARFGEIEQRGVALTVKGRQMYDEALSKSLQGDGSGFDAIPDSWEELRKQGLAHFEYRPTRDAIALASHGAPFSNDLEQLIKDGHVEVVPIVYEDFLPASAAGIFASNQAVATQLRKDGKAAGYTVEDLEAIIGKKILDYHAMYAAQEANSIASAYKELDAEMPKDLAAKVKEALARDPLPKKPGTNGSDLGGGASFGGPLHDPFPEY